MASSDIQAQLGQALVDFSTNGAFPEEEAVSAAYVEDSALPAALVALDNAKAGLESEIRQISSDSAPDVDTWITNAKSLQDNVEKSRKLANSIIREAEADEERLERVQENENYVDFLAKETAFNDQLLEALRSIQRAHDSLDKAEELASERKILEALRLLEDSWSIIAVISADRTTRAIGLLDSRCFEVRDFAHGHLLSIWNILINFNKKESTLTINQTHPDETTNLDEALVGLKAYKELDQAAQKAWENFDEIVLKPRTELVPGNLPTIQIQENSIGLGKEQAGRTIKALFLDLEGIIRFLIKTLPSELLQPFSRAMMPTLSSRIKEMWLDTAVPASLDDMVPYRKALAQVNDFATTLDSLQWPGVEAFYDWVSNAPKIWLNHRREATLDWTRNQLSLGVGVPQMAERIESRMVAREDGAHIASTGNMVSQDWDDAWDSDEDEKSAGNENQASTPMRNRHSIEEERRNTETFTSPAAENDDDDAADAWGWGDDDEADGAATEEPAANAAPPQPPPQRHITPEVRELTLSEKYWISSMPQPVFNTVVQIYEEGAQLTRPESEHIPVTAAAPGLFSLPTLILAMYRAVSPFYYANDPSGNMYQYNDSVWLVGQLKEFASKWKERPDLTPRAYGMVRLDNDFSALESFGRRAYTNELNNQRTIISDLLGGAQNFLQNDSPVTSELEETTRTVIKHIRNTAALWEKILPYSAWASAVGSLVNAVANKLINDVFDMSSMSVDEAESTAKILKIVEELDDLFICKPSGPSGNRNATAAEDSIPMTAQFADKWMKMKFLNETLQSNLNDIKFLWFESDLSLYFTVDEVVELIGLSFENNPSVRAAIREIRDRPYPREEA